MSHPCDWCDQPLTRSAPDNCINPEHHASGATLGLREAGCGCCVVVDRVALNLLTAQIHSFGPQGGAT